MKRKNQLYFNLVLIYTDNKVKSKEGKRRNGLRHNFSFYQQYQLVIRLLFLFSRRDFSLLDESERRYAENGLTHVDFLIYNKVGRQPVLVIETDGHQHHKEGSRQKERDIMKDRILELYGIPCERLKTTESNERERIETRLKDVLHIN